MKPGAWSFSSLDKFVNCPRQFHAVKVAKTVVEPETEQMRWGTWMHKQFEDRQKFGRPLPADIMKHETFMLMLLNLPGTFETEQKVALDRRGMPTTFFAKDVWWRGIIDYVKINGTHAYVADYKTGKPHQKFGQLKLFALYIFAKYPEVRTVKVEFYWTATMTCTGDVYTRDMSSRLWSEFVPNLKQYMKAFHTNTWQPRPSGLCNGWCPVTTCEFWKPKRG